MLRLDHQLSGVGYGCGRFDCNDLRPWTHDLGDPGIAELDDGLNELALGLLDYPGLSPTSMKA